MTERKTVMLCILDGWGLSPFPENNAVTMADTPNFDRLWDDNPHTTLRADGLYVGLPEGQFGNSEVGHMNIGAGRVVMQDLPRITQALHDGSMAGNPILLDFISRLKQSGGRAHVMGLVSTGGVHAHLEHIVGTIRILAQHDVPVVMHIFTDGRDTPPSSAREYVASFLKDLEGLTSVTIGTLSGRFYAMDRDNRWERVSRVWEAIVKGKGLPASDALQAISQSYDRNERDEFIQPTVIDGYKGLNPEDGLLMTNFRSDRVREILRALVQSDFDEFSRGEYAPLHLAIGMVGYAADLNKIMPAIFTAQSMDDLLGDVVSRSGLTQLRAAETEKYPHITFFFNGGREEPYPGEQRILVPSPKVATYDLQPEMSAPELTDRIVEAVNNRAFDFIVLNFANPDMVGHTGDLKAAIQAVETVDNSLGLIFKALESQNGVLVVTADHGNADQMVDPVTHQPHTAHTTFPVPFIIAGACDVKHLRLDGKLADIAPTLLHLLGIAQPASMTGRELIIE